MEDPACAAADLSAPGCTETATPIEPDPAVLDPRPTAWDHVVVSADGRSLEVSFWMGVEGCYGLHSVEVTPADSGIGITAPDRHSRRCRGSPVCRVGTAVLHHGDARGSTHQQRGLTRRSGRPQAGEPGGRGQPGEAETASSASSRGRGRGAFSSPRWLQIQRAASWARRTDRARPRSSTTYEARKVAARVSPAPLVSTTGRGRSMAGKVSTRRSTSRQAALVAGAHDHHPARPPSGEVLGHPRRVGEVGRRDEQDVRGGHEVGPVGVVGVDGVLEVAADAQPLVLRDGQQLAAPVIEVAVQQGRPAQGRPAGREIDGDPR